MVKQSIISLQKNVAEDGGNKRDVYQVSSSTYACRWSVESI